MATERRVVGVPPELAFRIWTSPSRWATFVDGFARVLEQRGDWPEPEARIAWESVPSGRGRVTERVLAAEPPKAIVTEVFEDALMGTQHVTFSPAGERETDVLLELDYKLTKSGPLRVLTDVLFIRRSLQEALGRTLVRFAREAEEEAGLM